MPEPHNDWTVEMVHALPDDGNRYEVIDGELFVTPAPSLTHQDAVLELAFLLLPYVRAIGIHLVVSPAAVTFSMRRQVQPDLFALPLVNGKRPDRFEDVGALVLAVEVLSPSTTRVDRQTKRSLYQSEHVPEYWIVNVGSRQFERWRPDDDQPEILRTTWSWQPLPSHDPLVIDLEAYFRVLHGI